MLHSTIEFIASLWPQKAERERYQAAAADFRVPYWDWAVTPPMGESVLPRSVWEDSMIDVDGPNGVQKISNPFFAYGFKPLDTSAFTDAPVCKIPTLLFVPTHTDHRVMQVGYVGIDNEKPYKRRQVCAV